MIHPLSNRVCRFSCCGSIVAVAFCAAILILPTHASGNELSYRPEVGQEYEYAIELKVSKKDEPQKFKSFRCRLVYTITKSDSTGWEATYLSRPQAFTTKESFERSLEMTRKTIQQGGLAGAPNPNDPRSRIPEIRAAQGRAAAAFLASAKARLQNINYFPGLFGFCEGSLRVAPTGEVLELTGPGELLMLAGHIAKVPLFRLPPPDGTSRTVGYRDSFDFHVIINEGGEYRETKGMRLHSVRQTEEGTGAQVKFDRDVEMSGGATAALPLTASGSGFVTFSQDLSRPYSGNLDLDCSGFSAISFSGDLSLRLGFHHLNEARRAYFDAGLLPIDDALSAKALPRTTTKLQKEIIKNITSNHPLARLDAMNYARSIAPPTLGSSLDRDMKDLRDQLKAKDDARGSGQRIDRRSKLPSGLRFVEVEAILNRWDQIRRLAHSIPRTWSDASGSFRIEANLVAVDEASVTLRRVDNGQEIKVPKDRLSESDKEYATNFGMPTGATLSGR